MCHFNYQTCKARGGLSGSTSHYPLSHKPQVFLETFINRKKCGLIFSTTFYVNFLIPSSIQRDTIKLYIGHQVRYSLFFSDYKEPWILSTDFQKTPQYKISWRPVQRDSSCSKKIVIKGMATIKFAFRIFHTVPKKLHTHTHIHTHTHNIKNTHRCFFHIILLNILGNCCSNTSVPLGSGVCGFTWRADTSHEHCQNVLKVCI